MRRWNVRWSVAAVLLVALAACGAGGPPAHVPGSTHAVAERTAPPSTVAAVTAAPTIEQAWTIDYAHIPQSKTKEGYYVLGKPDAPVLLQLYSDLYCGTCASYVVATEPQIIALYQNRPGPAGLPPFAAARRRLARAGRGG